MGFDYVFGQALQGFLRYRTKAINCAFATVSPVSMDYVEWIGPHRTQTISIEPSSDGERVFVQVFDTFVIAGWHVRVEEAVYA